MPSSPNSSVCLAPNISPGSTIETTEKPKLALDLRLADCFNACFMDQYFTAMVGGALEPSYIPPEKNTEGVIYYRENYAASVLHEAAHWCIAGLHRRGLEDFGYIYIPPPRTPLQQQTFLAYELKAQSLEYLFAQACNLEFVASVDNHLAGDQAEAIRTFTNQIMLNQKAIALWLGTQAGERARRLLAALHMLRESNLLDQQNELAGRD